LPKKEGRLHEIEISKEDLIEKLSGDKAFNVICKRLGVSVGDILMYHEQLEDGAGDLDHRFLVSSLTHKHIIDGYVAAGEKYISSVGVIDGERYLYSSKQ